MATTLEDRLRFRLAPLQEAALRNRVHFTLDAIGLKDEGNYTGKITFGQPQGIEVEDLKYHGRR